MKRWSHGHSLLAGGFMGVIISGHVVFLMAGALVAGVLLDRLLVNWRAVKGTAAQLLEDRERRANAAAVDRRQAGERAGSRLALAWAKWHDELERRGKYSQNEDDIPF